MRLRKVLRISRWEVSRTAGGLDRRSLGFAILVFVLVAAVAPFAFDGGLYDELYVVGVEDDDGYHEAVERADTLRAVEPSWSAFSSGDIDVLVRDDIHVADDQKGEAAVAELRDAARRYNAGELAEKDPDAAFPVSVEINYVDRDAEPAEPGDTFEPVAEEEDSEDEDADDDDDGVDAPDAEEDVDDGFSLPSGGLGGIIGQGGRSGTPDDIAPPFPFESLILAFAFLVPLNFVVQAYSTSVMNERIGRRGVLMLASPVSRQEIIAGKTVPYFAAALALVAAVAAVVGGGWRSVVAMVPVLLIFLSLTFVGAMFARSYKELTFVTVFVSVVVTSYVFIPAIFTDIDPVAAISPLSIVVRDLQQAASAAPASWYVFSGAPLVFSSAVLFSLGSGVYREEEMFNQRRVPHKAVAAVASWLRRRASVAKVSVFLVPFVFAIQLLVVATLFALPVEVSLPLFFVAAAVVEEVAKSVSVYAGFAHSVFERNDRNAVVLGAISGAGFFVGEKFAHLAQLVGLDTLEIGRAALGVGFDVSPLVLVALFFAPLVLHAVAASLAALGACRGKRGYLVGLVAAVVVHVAYNLTVVGLVA